MNQPSGTKQMTSSTSQACVMQSLQTNWSAHTALILEKGLACADPGIAQMLQMSKIEVSNSPGSDALESVWQVSKTGAGDYLSLYSIQDTVFLLSHRGAKYQVAKIMGRVTTASFAFLGSRVLVMVGNDGGLVTISMFDSNRGTVKPIAQSTVSSNLCDGPIAFTAYQPADFATRSDTNSLYVWVVRKRTAKRVTMAESSSESVIELLHINTITGTCKELYQFCADESFGNFARLEILDTRLGPATLVAVHFLKTVNESGSTVSKAVISTIDARFLLGYADHIHQGGQGFVTEATDLPSPLMLPAISKDCSSNKSFLFSFASPSKSYESIIYAMIVPASICIWSSCLDYSSPLATLEGRPFSYTVVAFGSSGSIIECSFKSSPQQVIDCILNKSIAVLADPTVACVPRESLHVTIRTSNWEVLGSSEEPVSQILPSLGNGGSNYNAVPLWKACASLQMFTPERISPLSELSENILKHDSIDNILSADELYFIQRLFVLETCIAAGLSIVVSDYILAVATNSGVTNVYSSESTYLLADIKRMYDWIAFQEPYSLLGVEIHGLQKHVTNVIVVCLQNTVVPFLLRGNTAKMVGNSSSCFPVDASMELQSLATMCEGVINILEAMLKRKMESEFDADNSALVSVIDNAQISLYTSISEMRSYLSTVRLVQLILSETNLDFSSVLLSPDTDTSCYCKSLQIRRSVEPRMEFLPAFLKGSLLIDELVRLLSEAGTPQAAQLVSTAFSGTIDIGESAETVLTYLLLLPVNSLQELSMLPNSTDKGFSLVEAQLASIFQISQSIVMYFVLDQFMATNTSLTCNDTITWMTRLPMLGGNLSKILELPEDLAKGVLALWRIDASVGVIQATRQICSTEAPIVKDFQLCKAALRRLICTGKSNEARSFLGFLLCSAVHGSVLNSDNIEDVMFLVLCMAAAIPSKDCWTFVWHETRQMYNSLTSSLRDSICREVVRLYCRWALVNSELTKLLGAKVDRTEFEEIREFLLVLAKQEMDTAALRQGHCPTVDVLVGYLLAQTQHPTRVQEAKEIHLMHLAAIGANPDLLVVGKGNIATIGGLQLVDSVLRQSVTQREALIKAHDSVSVSSSIFFRDCTKRRRQVHGSQEAENQLVTNYYQTLQKDVVSSKERIPESGVKRLRIETGKYESNATSPFRFPSADFAM